MKLVLRSVMVGWAALSVIAGCGGVTLAPDGGSNAGHGGGGNAGGSAGIGGAGGDAGSLGGHAGSPGQDGGATLCSGLDQSRCSATPGCAALACPTCSGQTVFLECYRVQGAPPPSCIPMGCPDPQSCNGLNEGLCKGRSDCTAEYCANCSGGQTFVGCAAPGGAGFACPAYACPAPAPCANVTTLAACDARTDCHSVFVDPGTCGCAAVGCCAYFARCAAGGKASCKGKPVCQTMTPYCDAPAFVVSYTPNCYEGCVRPTECAP